MAIDTFTPRTRRALLAGVVASLAAVAAQAARPFTAKAEGETIHVGDNLFNAQTVTWVKNTANDNDVFKSESTGSGTGVYGVSAGGTGLRARSARGLGVLAHSGDLVGVLGFGRTIGVSGSSEDGIGTSGYSLASWGVRGLSVADDRASVYGEKPKDSLGKPLLGNAVLGEIKNPDNRSSAVAGTTAGPGAAIRGRSLRGRGGQFEGAVAQVRLIPSTAAAHPTSGARGDLFLDRPGRLWFCKGGTNWKQLA